MAFERMGLGGVVTLDTDPAVRSLGAGRNALGRFTRQTSAVGPAAGRMATSFKRATQRIKTSLRGSQAGLDKFSGAMRSAALVTVPAGIIMYKAAKSAANFEQAIADLGAVSGASEKDLARLSAKAKEMGIVTAFSASESANAMEQLARAGATVEEQISGVRSMTCVTVIRPNKIRVLHSILNTIYKYIINIHILIISLPKLNSNSIKHPITSFRNDFFRFNLGFNINKSI